MQKSQKKRRQRSAGSVFRAIGKAFGTLMLVGVLSGLVFVCILPCM